MLYGYSGYGGLGQMARAATTSSGMSVQSQAASPVASACARLRMKLRADGAADPIGICGGNLFQATCAAKQIQVPQSPFRKQLSAELAAIASSGGAAQASQLLYCVANAAAQETDMSSQSALLYLRAEYLRTVGQNPLSPEQVAQQTGAQVAAPSGASIYGGTLTADAAKGIGPAPPSQTVVPPGAPQQGGPTTADTETGITKPPGDVYVPSDYELCAQQGGVWDDVTKSCLPPPVNGGGGAPVPTGKKAMWPWLLLGAVVVGGLGYAAYRKR